MGKEGAPKFAVEKPKEVVAEVAPVIELSEGERKTAKLGVDLFKSEEEKLSPAKLRGYTEGRKLRMFGRAACTALALVAVFAGMESAQAQNKQSKWQRVQKGLEIFSQVKGGFDEAKRQRLNIEHERDISQLQLNYNQLVQEVQSLDNVYLDKRAAFEEQAQRIREEKQLEGGERSKFLKENQKLQRDLKNEYLNRKQQLQHGAMLVNPKTSKPLTNQPSQDANRQATQIIDAVFREEMFKLNNDPVNSIGRGLGRFGGLRNIGLGDSGAGRPYGGGDFKTGKKIGL